MAIQIRPDIYNGGAVPINLSPFANYYVQRENKRQAKEQAFDSYMKDMDKDLSPTGMRGIDIQGDENTPGYVQQVNEWRKNAIANKKAIMNPTIDGGKALTEFNEQFNRLKAIPEMSKNAAKFMNEIGKQKALGKLNLTDNDIVFLDSKSKPVMSTGYDARGWEGMDINVPALDTTKFIKDVSFGLKPGRQYDEGKIRINKPARQQFMPFTESFDNDQLSTIGKRAELMYENNPSVRKNFELSDFPENELKNLNEVYKNVTGKEIESDKELAAAWAINQNMTPSSGEEMRVYVDPDEKYQQQIDLINRRAQSQLNVSRTKKAEAKAENDKTVKEYTESVIGKAKENKPTTIKNLYGTESVLAYDVPMTADVISATVGPVSSNNPKPDVIRYVPNKGFVAMFYEYKPDEKEKDSSGNPIYKQQFNAKGEAKIDTKRTITIPLNQFTANIGKYYFSTKGLPQYVRENEIDMGTPSQPSSTNKAILD